ncbi:transmembrane protein 273-like [Anguilla anguilla]|uniref:Uncharacterized protein n=1 Tax=Anguilla anguilla TaxID=7936 RepID=A0A0E9WNH1_ANGAN|nr:transmembrane protein 273-like [Anguilla anguilla]KAG5855309.1 hypothetical protein ANANG_G00047750 [Anguilla anguilla]
MAIHSGLCALIMIFFIDCLMIKVHGKDPNNADEKDFKYAAIGIGIGAFFSVCFVAIKLYMLRKHIFDNALSDCDSTARPSSRTVVVELKAGESLMN